MHALNLTSDSLYVTTQFDDIIKTCLNNDTKR